MKRELFHFIRRNLPGSDRDRGIYSIAISQFGLAFCFNVVMSFMPFYIVKVSSYGSSETMVWIGLIMGLNSFVSTAAAPFWGSLTAKYRPKTLFQGAFMFNGVLFLLMGFTENLPLLLALRLIQGALGGASTIGIFMISQLSSKERLAGNLGLYQNSLTGGQLLGPPVGAYLASQIGYRAPFVFSFLLVGIALLLCHFYIVEIDKKGANPERKIGFNPNLLWGWALSFIATIHLTFLPSILPHILEGFDLVGETALKSAGFIMMGYTVTAIVGNYLISRMTARTKLTKVITVLCLVSALLQLMLIVPGGVIGFAVVRMLQTGVVAAVIPLVMASLASELGGTGIGFLNSARFAGNGVGPLIATFVLAGSSLLTLYLLIAALTILLVSAFWLTSVGRAS